MADQKCMGFYQDKLYPIYIYDCSYSSLYSVINCLLVNWKYLELKKRIYAVGNIP